jgi:hypothetical protein
MQRAIDQLVEGLPEQGLTPQAGRLILSKMGGHFSLPWWFDQRLVRLNGS